MGHIHELDITFVKVTPQVRNSAASLLSAPALRRVWIWDDPDILRALAWSTSVRELALCWLDEDVPSEWWDNMPIFKPDSTGLTQLFMETVAALPLQKLELKCGCNRLFTRKLRYLEAFDSSSDFPLRRRCPDLSSFDMSFDNADDDSPYWRLWSTLPNISEVSIGAAPPKWVVLRLKTLQSVKLRPFDSALRWAARSGKCVSRLAAGFHIVMSEFKAIS